MGIFAWWWKHSVLCMETWVTYIYRFIKTDFTIYLWSVYLSILKSYLNLKKKNQNVYMCVYNWNFKGSRGSNIYIKSTLGPYLSNYNVHINNLVILLCRFWFIHWGCGCFAFLINFQVLLTILLIYRLHFDYSKGWRWRC